MYIETKIFKVKFKDNPLIFFMPGTMVNMYYDEGMSEIIEYVEELKK